MDGKERRNDTTVPDFADLGPGQVPSYQQLQRWNATTLPDLPRLEIAILRNIVLDPIVPHLRFFAWREGFDATCRFGEYDNVAQDAIGWAPDLLNDRTDCVLVFTRLDTLSPALSRTFAALGPDDIAEEIDRITGTLESIVAGIRRQTDAMILWHSFEMPLDPALGTLDGQRRGEGQTGAVRALNERLGKILQGVPGSYLVDMNRCIGRVGTEGFHDARYWHAARAPYTLRAVREIAFEDMKFIRALKGRARKCLVLDCDGVLWGGTIGEDGLAGIRLGRTHPGSGYYEFQQEVLNLYHRGVLIALCSKNNEADVWEVFDRHPDMVLERRHIAAARINWNDKASNLVELARELNIGIDSLVMMDDSDFEVNLIRQFAPEVTVIGLPGGRASEFASILASCGLFDTLTLSAEDRSRGAAYQAEAGRRELQRESSDMDSFLRSLEMRLEIGLTDDFARPRVAQLTQKTNQFNLTTRRYSEQDIQRFSERDDADVIHLRYGDRFGDAGIVGVCILEYADGIAAIDTLLLSCRVLGRSVEGAFLGHCVARAVERGATSVTGEYIATAKNAQVREFYAANGFSVDHEEGDRVRFRLDPVVGLDSESDLFTITSGVLQAVLDPAANGTGSEGDTTA
jgi:FkbH-like protein